MLRPRARITSFAAPLALLAVVAACTAQPASRGAGKTDAPGMGVDCSAWLAADRGAHARHDAPKDPWLQLNEQLEEILFLGDVQGAYPAVLIALQAVNWLQVRKETAAEAASRRKALARPERTTVLESHETVTRELSLIEIAALPRNADADALAELDFTWLPSSSRRGFIQLGDVASGRGPGTYPALELMARLQQAARSEGDVFEAVMGNHDYCLTPHHQCKDYDHLYRYFEEDNDRICEAIHSATMPSAEFLWRMPFAISIGRSFHVSHTGFSPVRNRDKLDKLMTQKQQAMPSERFDPEVFSPEDGDETAALFGAYHWWRRPNSGGVNLPGNFGSYIGPLNAESLVVGHMSQAAGPRFKNTVACANFPRAGAKNPDPMRCDMLKLDTRFDAGFDLKTGELPPMAPERGYAVLATRGTDGWSLQAVHPFAPERYQEVPRVAHPWGEPPPDAQPEW